MAQVIAADAGTPAHCRVSGRVPAAIRFVAELPLDWNGRLYLHGDGGEALDHPPYAALHRNALPHDFAAAFADTGHAAGELLSASAGDPARDSPESARPAFDSGPMTF